MPLSRAPRAGRFHPNNNKNNDDYDNSTNKSWGNASPGSSFSRGGSSSTAVTPSPAEAAATGCHPLQTQPGLGGSSRGRGDIGDKEDTREMGNTRGWGIPKGGDTQGWGTHVEGVTFGGAGGQRRGHRGIPGDTGAYRGTEGGTPGVPGAVPPLPLRPRAAPCRPRPSLPRPMRPRPLRPRPHQTSLCTGPPLQRAHAPH